MHYEASFLETVAVIFNGAVVSLSVQYTRCSALTYIVRKQIMNYSIDV